MASPARESERDAEATPQPDGEPASLSPPQSCLACVVERLPAPRVRVVDRISARSLLGQVARDPLPSAKLLAVASLVYLAVALLFELLGLWAILVLALGVWRAVYEAARAIVWPGQMRVFARKVERMAALDLLRHFEACAASVDSVAATLISAPHSPRERVERIARSAGVLVEPLVDSAVSFACGPDAFADVTAAQRELVDAMVEFRQARAHLSAAANAGENVVAPAQRLLAACGRLRAHAGVLVEEPAKAGEVDTSSNDNSAPHLLLLPSRVWRNACAHIASHNDARRRFGGLASFDLYRHHLVASRQGRRHSVVSRDGTRLDAVLIPGVPQPARLVVVLCNPNAAVFELLALHSFWVDRYCAHADVVAWNYRGYGQSQGSVSPGAMREDIEAVVRHFACEGVGMLVHGESIGGIASCHAAGLPQVSMVIADRTFASIDAIALQLVGPLVARAFRRLTQWSCDNVAGALRSGARVVVMQDVGDAVIPYRASLKTGVARVLCPVDNELALAHALGVLVASCKEDLPAMRIPSPVLPHAVVDFVPPVLTTTQRAALMPFVVRVMHFAACGQTLGAAVGAELGGRRGAVGDWFACARVWAPALPRLELEAGMPGECQAAADTVLAALALRPAADSAQRPRFVNLTCGHSGQPSEAELAVLDEHLKSWRAADGGA